MATLRRASLSTPFSPRHLGTSCVSHVLVSLAIFQTWSLLYFSYGGLQSVIFDVTKMKRLRLAEDSDDGLAIKYLSVKVCAWIFWGVGHNAIPHLIDYSTM